MSEITSRNRVSRNCSLICSDPGIWYRVGQIMLVRLVPLLVKTHPLRYLYCAGPKSLIWTDPLDTHATRSLMICEDPNARPTPGPAMSGSSFGSFVWTLFCVTYKVYYSETCLKRPLKKKTKNCFQGRLSLNAGQKYCRMLQGVVAFGTVPC